MVYMIILSLIAGALGLYYYLREDRNIFKKHGIPHPKPLPIIGNMASTLLHKESISDFMKKIYDFCPEAKYVGVYQMSEHMIMLRDIELIKSIALKHFDMFPDHRVVVKEDQDLLFSKNLASLQGDKWRETRGILSPSFTSSKMKNMFKLMSDCAVDFGNFLAQLSPEQRVMDTKDYFSRYTIDVIATCAFGVSVDSLRDPDNLFYTYGKRAAIFEGFVVLKFFIFGKLPWLAKMLDLKFVDPKVAKFFRNLVETTIRSRDEQGIVRPDMMQLMMECRGGRKELAIDDITSQAFGFFLGGFDTTSTLMSFAAHEIAVNEDIQRRLQDEIDQVLEDTNGQLSYEAINNMEYLDAVINETLRMYPSGVVTDRVCEQDFELPPAIPGAKAYTVKKNNVVLIPIYGLHHDPKYFTEPAKFDPERFIGENKRKIINSGAYMPFGVGPRMCIGNRFGLLEVKVLFFHLLARCELVPCEKTTIPMKLAKDGILPKAEGGFWLKVLPRKDPHRFISVNNANDTRDI